MLNALAENTNHLRSGSSRNVVYEPLDLWNPPQLFQQHQPFSSVNYVNPLPRRLDSPSTAYQQIPVAPPNYEKKIPIIRGPVELFYPPPRIPRPTLGGRQH